MNANFACFFYRIFIYSLNSEIVWMEFHHVFAYLVYFADMRANRKYRIWYTNEPDYLKSVNIILTVKIPWKDFCRMLIIQFEKKGRRKWIEITNCYPKPKWCRFIVIVMYNVLFFFLSLYIWFRWGFRVPYESSFQNVLIYIMWHPYEWEEHFSFPFTLTLARIQTNKGTNATIIIIESKESFHSFDKTHSFLVFFNPDALTYTRFSSTAVYLAFNCIFNLSISIDGNEK